MRAAVLSICLGLAATPALPGAWPRAPGEIFLSARTDFDVTEMGKLVTASVYGEYGLSKRLTAIGQVSNADNPWTGSRASVALQVAVSPEAARHKFALSAGVSAPPDVTGAMLDTQIETGLHWGMGFESRYGAGWATITGRVLHSLTESDFVTDVYGLVGVRPREGWMTMISASRYENADGVTWKVSPSLGYALRDEAWLVPNVTRQVGGAEETTLGLSIWLTF